MATCKRAALLATSAALFLAANNLSAQTVAPAAPTAPVVPVQPVTLSPKATMPSMPKISAPVAGSSFYTPGKNFLNQEKSAAQTQAAAEEKKSTASKNLESALLGEQGADFSGLTAQDLVQLAKSGSITNVSSLLQNNAFNRSSSSDAAQNKTLLNKILTELEEIKKSQSANLAAATTGCKPSALPPKILRFIVNANDVLSKCAQVYFSDRESDGSFLLTGDARTLFNNENVSETFYLLFKACGTKNSKTVYTVTPTLSQSKNADTPLQKFCSAKNMTASRVGNLVTLHLLQDGTMGDLLLDIGSAQ